MPEEENWIYKSRKLLIDGVLNKIDNSNEPNKVYLSVFGGIAKIGLHMKAQKLGLLEREKWQDKTNHPELIAKIKQFLWNEIK